MPLQATSGAASYDAFGGGVPVVPNYIEEVFSTYLYTGNGSTQTITNGIDLSTKGGLVWTKNRTNAYDNYLYDTARGVNKVLLSNNTIDQQSLANTLTAFNSTGFTLGNSDYGNITNGAAAVSWTWAKAPKFFDIQTWTGSGSNTTISHSLGSVPACIFVKRTDTTGAWQVYHRSLANTEYLVLNTTAAKATGATRWNSTTPTSTVFSIGTDATVNASGGTYVAYIFAHDSAGFGLTGTDNVISCGSYTGGGTGVNITVNLGWEPQWILVKNTSAAGDWYIADTMRGLTVSADEVVLSPNLSAAEDNKGMFVPTATGFFTDSTAPVNISGNNYIYIAIRRGPMKVPTSGTSVFGLNARTGTGAVATVTGSAGVSDAVIIKNRGSAVASLFSSRLTGTGYLVSSSTAAEVAAGTTILQASPWDVMDGVKVGTASTITNASANTYINYLFNRAPSVFDVCCYTGTGSTRTVTHNLQAVPELLIFKNRGSAVNWKVRLPSALANFDLALNTTSAKGGDTQVTSFTASSFTINGGSSFYNDSANTYVAYLFATCPNVSKVGSYTGTATTLQIDCGFTGGARLVLIKRTDSTGDWYVWDSARGIVSGNDSYLLLNSTAAEVTNTDYIDTYSAGFEISSTAPAAINASGGTFIFLAIA
tara:strand:- start:1916 stop:3871 length:1956 start_codon:yes stop_codon:yes gene_type:complete